MTAVVGTLLALSSRRTSSEDGRLDGRWERAIEWRERSERGSLSAVGCRVCAVALWSLWVGTSVLHTS